MAAKRDLNSALVSVIETTEGIAESATPSTDVVLVENLQLKFNESQQTTQEVTGTLDSSTDIPIGGAASVTFDTWLKGSGTPGTAPEIGKLLKACAYGETITASAIGVPTAATAATANSVTVPASPFAGAVDAYLGMVAQLTGNPTGPIFTGILGFSASQVMTLAESFSPVLSTSTLVKIPANVLYLPVSTGIPSLTHYVYKDGVLHTIVGCRGTVDYAFEAGKGIKLSWSFQGILTVRTDASNPTNNSPDSAVSKLVWRNDANNGAFTLNGTRRGLQMLNFKTGNALDNAPNPNQPQGFDVADVGSRTMTGDINPRLTAVSDIDILALKRAGTPFTINAIARRSAGNGFSLLLPAAEATSYEYEKQGPMIGQKIPFKATGANKGAALCFF
jgi:hypothetical protein